MLTQNVRVVAIKDIKNLLHTVGLKSFILQLIDRLESDFSRWQEFHKSPRHAIHYPHGVIELMPISDKKFYSFKYVNGHPKNPLQGHQTVVAVGQLSDVASGYPILISEMTILTAIRTAATSALASKYLARKNAKTFGIIGTGAQSEFQTLAHHFALGIEEIFYFDIDAHAMEKFAANLQPFGLRLHPCKDGRSVVEKSDLVTSATAAAGHLKIIFDDWVKKGTHINGIGGDSPGKTELDLSLLEKSKVVVELMEQTKIEGEIQQMKHQHIYGELWEIVSKKKPGRESDQEITLFDSVGFALEDYSALQLVNDLASERNIGHMIDLIPHPKDPKNLFGVIV